ncbi:hypothetical protein JHK87_033640 [Glycine soja]|nr:hypothetical protein JHK87_033640 [Glycine soja]
MHMARCYSKFLFGYDDSKLWFLKQISPKPESQTLAAIAAVDCVSTVKNQRGKICILAINCGGMRGILARKALTYLDAALKKKSGDQNATIADYFILAADAEVGYLFVTMLFSTKDHCRPIFSADDMWRFLVEKGNKF